ncbi:helix-turn-helix domain-containing protein [Streptomyces antimycoticus]|uniref:helix-turn-helix domain-containing protein n=1 Tax=Streptomyces antimycoticus TaxID=68175 RepID=UPI0037CF25A3
MDGTGTSSQDPGTVVPIRPDSHPQARHDAHVDHLPPTNHPHASPDSVISDITAPVEPQGQNDPVRQAAEAFAAELFRLRTGHGLSQFDLARRLGYDKSRVTHLERCTQAPTQHVARRADHILGSGEALTRLWHAYHIAHAAERRHPHHALPPTSPASDTPDGSGPDAAAARDTPHGTGERASTSSTPDADHSEQPAAPPETDRRGETKMNWNVQFGDGNTQNITF